MKNFGEKGAWTYTGTSQIFSQGPSELKSLKNFGEKGAWAYPGTAQIF